MKITILNGNSRSAENWQAFSQVVEDLNRELSHDNDVSVFNLEEMNLKYCSGCWSCWVKTPGQCAIKDGAETIFSSVINSDALILASPLIAGFTSAELKKITDRLIVLLHPYVEIHHQECHHRKRYEKYPDFSLIIQKEADTDNEDIGIIKDLYDRLALNFHCKQLFTQVLEQDSSGLSINRIIEELSNETCSV